MSHTAETPPLDRTRPLLAAVTLARSHAFALGVAAISAAAAGFLLHQLMAWPPHEDETLALFIGHNALGGLFQVVLEERGGAPLHFLVAWAVAHSGLGLGGLRLCSALFAVASLPLVALLGRRLAGRGPALFATVVVAASWTFLFHGVYARMYSLFLFTSLLSYLAFLRALDRGDRRSWGLWVAAVLAAVATHPYGALVLGSQLVFLLAARRKRLREAALPFLAIALAGIPFWLTDLVLAGRFEVGVGPGGQKLGGPVPVLEYLWEVAGDFSAGFPVLPAVLLLAAAGVAVLRRETLILAGAAIAVPTLVFMLARLGSATSPETRHLIFVLPFFAIAVGAGLQRLGPRWGAASAAMLAAAQLAWAWDKTPDLFAWEPEARIESRGAASAFLAATSRPDDILFGYEPLYLRAWELDRGFPSTVLPRADAKLALSTLLDEQRPLGRGVWILDASEPSNGEPSLEIALVSPRPPGAFDVRRFGPFLVIRTKEPTRTPARYLELAGRAILVGKRLYIGDADINLVTVERAARELRGYGAPRSLSTSSR